MQLKRILVSLLVVVLMLSATVVASASEDIILTTSNAVNTFDAAAATTPAADADGNLLANAGDEIVVSITINNNPGATCVDFKLLFDEAELVPVKDAEGNVVVKGDVYNLTQVTVKEGIISISSDYNSLTVSNATGVVATVTFKVAENFHGTATLDFIANGAVRKSAADMSVLPVNAKDVNVLVHSFGEGVETAPTCVDGGYTTFACSECDAEVKMNLVDALGHTEETVAAVAPTCSATGLTEGTKCAVCGEVLVAQEEVAVDPTAHTAEVVPAVDATCTTAGKTAGSKCADCGAVLAEGEAVAAKGHTAEVIPAVEPTTSEVGYTEGEKCSVCGEILKAPVEIAKKPLTWLWIAIAAVVVVGAGVAVFFVTKNNSKKRKLAEEE